MSKYHSLVKGSYNKILILIDTSFKISILILKVLISISFPAPARKNFQNCVVVYQRSVVCSSVLRISYIKRFILKFFMKFNCFYRELVLNSLSV